MKSAEPLITDRWVDEKSKPAPDQSSDVSQLSGYFDKGNLTFSFARPLVSSDKSEDIDLTSNACIYILTAQGKTSNFDIRYHGYDSRKPTGEPNGEPKGEPTGEPNGEPSGEPNGEPIGEQTGGSNLHQMDCVDMVIGTAIGQFSRIGDYYTRDRSTPLFDDEYGGQDDLTAAFGYEEDGETTLVFRRKLEASETSDWPIENSLMHIVWARGQQEGDIKHWPDSALEKKQADADYYRKDELKYHGHGNHRGAASFNFFDAPAVATSDCTTGGCTDLASCPFKLSWTYNASDDSVTFDIEADVQPNTWVAIGFSKDNFMPETDVVAAYIVPGGAGTMTVSDRYADGRTPPTVDSVQNAIMVSGSRDGGLNRVVFKRPARTSDTSRDIDLHSNGGAEDDCPYVFLGKGGDVAEDETMSYHLTTPVRVGRICFGICAGAGPISVPRETRATLTVRVPFKLRLVQQTFSSALEDPTSAEYRQLATNLETQ
ncbi:cell surface glycoprotein 1, partial [Elysia marginata]